MREIDQKVHLEKCRGCPHGHVQDMVIQGIFLCDLDVCPVPHRVCNEFGCGNLLTQNGCNCRMRDSHGRCHCQEIGGE